MHCFTISTCESVSHFTDKLRTQFNKGKRYQKRYTRSRNNKNVAITDKKEEQYAGQIIHTNQGHLFTKVTPNIYFTYEPVTQYGFPVVSVANCCTVLEVILLV